MTILGSEGLVSAELVGHFSAVTRALPLHGELFVATMDTIWLSVLPSVDVPVG